MFVYWLLTIFISFIQLSSSIARPQTPQAPQGPLAPAGVTAPIIANGADDDQFLNQVVQILNDGINQIEDANNKGDRLSVNYIAGNLTLLIPQLNQAVKAVANNAARVSSSADTANIQATTNVVAGENDSITSNLYHMAFSWDSQFMIKIYVDTVRAQIADAAQQFAHIKSQGALDKTVA